MSRLGRGVGRLMLMVARLGLRPLELLAPRLYMSLYCPLLALFGLNLKGTPRYISSTAYFDDFAAISLGERVVISRGVTLLTHDYALTTALNALGEPPVTDIRITRPIAIGDNVFVGLGCTLLPGTTIGSNVIIGAGSVVRGTVRSGTIVMGNPSAIVGTIADKAEHWRALRDGGYATPDRQ